MQGDLVERLRHADTHSQQRVMGSRIFGEAADRIVALEAWKAEAMEVLRPFVRIAEAEDFAGAKDGESIFVNVNLCRAARRLVEKGDGR